MTGTPLAQRRKYWIFCSSGSRPLYLENVVRVLALPPGEVVKFRYEADIVSSSFKERVGKGLVPTSVPAVGDIAYISYLDNRDKLKKPRIFPVREATIRSVAVLGTTYVIQLVLQCYFNWNADEKLDQSCQDVAIDKLVSWVPEGERDPAKIQYEGYWVAEASALPEDVFIGYCPLTRSHLEAFESSARAISFGADFSDGKRLFISFLGLYDVRRREWVQKEPLRAGGIYELFLYYFKPERGMQQPLEMFTITASTDNEDIEVVGSSERAIEASYDEVVFTFRTKEDAKDGVVNLNIDVWRVEAGDGGRNDQVYILRGAIRRMVKSSLGRKIWFGFLIGVGLFGSQAVTLLSVANLDLGRFFVAFAFSIFGGMVAAFQFRTRV